MANSDKDILITPNSGSSSADPKIEYVGANSSGNDTITVETLYDGTKATLSFEGSAGQLFSVVNDLSSDPIFSVNDVSGIPSIEVDSDGEIRLAEFSGNVGIGTSSPGALLDVNDENAVSRVRISRGGTDLSSNTDIGSLDFYADYSSSPIQYGTIQAYANNVSGLRGSLDFKVKSTSGNIITGLTLYGTNSGVNVGIGTQTPASLLDVDGRITANNLTLQNLSGQSSEATAVMIDGSGIIGTRELGSNAFNSTTIPSLSGYATESYVTTQINNLIDSAPGTLNTLNELAAALGDDANFSTTVTNSIATKMPLAGGTFTGGTTYNVTGNAITISSESPQIRFNDTTSGADDFWIHVNSDRFYILADRGDDGSWETPYPLELNAGTNIGYIFAQRAFTEAYHPNADKWTTARTLSLTGDVTGSVSWDGSGNASITTAVANDSHNHTKLFENSTITFGASQLQWMDQAGTGGTGLNGAAPRNPANGWYHNIITNHGNSNGYYSQLSLGINTDDFYFSKVINGTASAFQRVFMDNYHPNADKWTTARTLSLTGAVTGSVSWDGSGNASMATTATADPTLTLSGDASGSATFTNLGNATLSVTVNDDSHNHVISNVDGLQTALDGKTSLDHIRSLGTQAFTGTATTAGYISEMESDGAFDSYSSVFKTSWSYAGNFNISDAGTYGPTETAGMSHLTWTDNSSDSARGNITVLAIAPNTGGSGGRTFIYNDQGSSYNPGWREIWTSRRMGSGTGLDADKLDGLEGANYMRLDASADVTNYSHVHSFYTNGNIATASGSQSSLQCYNNTVGNDAFMTFHVGSDFACYFGLDGGTNKLSVGGWSMGANSYEIYHSGNKPTLAALGYTGATNANYITNNNQLTNGAGYITSADGGNAATLDGIDSSDFFRIDGAAQTTTSNVWARIQNTNTGTGDYSEFHIANNADHRLIIGSIGSNYSGGDWAGSRYIYTNSGELRIKSASNLRLYSGGTSHTGDLAVTFDTNQKAEFTQPITVTAPTSGTTAANRGFQVTTSSYGGLHVKGNEGGTSGSADTLPLITFPGNGTTVQGGIYSSQNSSTGTSLGFFTTNSYASGPQQSLMITDAGDVEIGRGALAIGQAYSSMDVANLSLETTGNMSIRGASALYFGVTTNNYGSWKTRIYSANTSTMYIHAQGLNVNNTGYGSVTFLTADANGVTPGTQGFKTTSYNKGGLQVTSNGTASTGASIGLQQVTSEGDTIIFADYEPHAEWGIYHENNSNLIYVQAGASTGNLGNYTVTNRTGNTRTAYIKHEFNQSTGTFRAGGTISSNADVIAYASDRRLKENFVKIESAVEKVQKLNGVTFDWNELSRKEGFEPDRPYNDVGLIAQEVQEVCEQAIELAPFDTKVISTPIDPKNKNKGTITKKESISGENYLTVKYDKLVPLLVEAIKEQQETIEKLTSRLNDIEKGE